MRDVAIVGGGSAGLLLGCLLAMRGIDVVVLERRARPGNRTRAIGIHAAGLAILDAAGVGTGVREEAAVVRRGIVTSRGRRLGEFEFGDAAILTLPQPRTEALLTARLAELAPEALARGKTVTELRVREDGVEVHTTSSDGGAGGDGGADRVLARYVVGADGTRSTIRAAIGASWAPWRGAAHYAMADEVGGAVAAGPSSGVGPDASASADPSTDPSTAALHLEPAGVVECFPLPDGGRRWVIRLEAPGTVLTRDVFAAAVSGRLGFGPVAQALAQPVCFTASQHLADVFARGRVALLGDAAHELSPIGGQGMSLGWLDAAALDTALARALAAGAPAAPFARYTRRRAAATRAMRRAAFNTRLGARIRGPRLALRNALVRLLALPAFRSLAKAVVTIAH